MTEDAAVGNVLSAEELVSRYDCVKGHFTAGGVFGKGDGELGTAVRDKVVSKNAAAKARVAKAQEMKTTAQRKDVAEYRKVMKLRKKKDFKWTNDRLKKAIKPLKTKDDGAMPGTRDLLLKLWEKIKIKSRPLP